MLIFGVHTLVEVIVLNLSMHMFMYIHMHIYTLIGINKCYNYDIGKLFEIIVKQSIFKFTKRSL